MAESGFGQGPEGTLVVKSPLELRLDPENPRLRRDERGASQDTLLEIMVRRFKIDELAESITTSGYIPFDPIIGCEESGSIVILEGNRRLAALQLLLDPTRAPQGQENIWLRRADGLSDDDLRALSELRVLVFPDRRQAPVKSYIGFRHVTGVLQWPALEKASYIADLVESDDWTYGQIADRLGSYPKHVERHYVAYRIVQQALDDGVEGATRMRDSFGVLMRALQAAGVAEFLGVAYPGEPAASLEPVPSDKRSNLGDFVNWTFGTKMTSPILRDSRQLTKWGKILGSPEAVAYLRRTSSPDFDRAWLRSGGQAASVSEALYAAADRLQESVPLLSELTDDAQVTSAVKECARYFAQVLPYFPNVAKQYRWPEN